MPEYNRGQQQSPSPSSRTAPMLPPLSKYYYGPAQGWNSTESSPSHNGSSWSLNHHDIPPALPPRLSPGPSAYSSPPWMNHSPYSAETSQGWHSPGLPPSAPPASQIGKTTQLANGHLPMPSNSHSHINPTWDSGAPDTSLWGVRNSQKTARGPEPTASKPPLPPRGHHQATDQPTSPESKTPSSRLSATTIDVPLFLQPVAYNPASAPPMPGLRHSLTQDVQTSILSPPEPERLPPPPPQKIPLGHEDAPEAPKIPQRPWYDPQHNSVDGQQKNLQISQCPRFEPPNPHDARNRPYQWQSHDQRPSIPVPQFTSFNVESALPPPDPQPELLLLPQQNLPQLTVAGQSDDLNRYKAGEVLYKSSTSPVDASAADQWVPTSIPWEPQAAYVPSPEQHHAVLWPPDKQSTSTTDFSIHTVGVSTPESHQTPNTSYRENDNREDRARPEQQGDDSFYWHSGRSSSDTGEDQSRSGSPTARPGDSVGQRSSTTISMGAQREVQDLPLRSTSLSPTTSATYGASALGFGGPSDWEYFGDYEAEEIDDEELYSRPRPRDLESVIERSTELPVDSPFDSKQPRNEIDLPGSNLMRLESHSLHEENLARPLGETLSHEQIVQESRVAGEGEGEGDYEIDAKPPSAHGTITPRYASGQVASSSDAHGQQRPDLDDVIRAWSEAPHVGKTHEVTPAAAIIPDSDEEPTSVAEASLASTPRERILGVDVILKGAPSLPKLPDSIDNPNPDERELQRNANISAIPPNDVSTPIDYGQQMQLVPNRQEPAKNDLMANAEAEPRKEETYFSQSEDTSQIVLPPVDVAVSSGLPLSISPESSINKWSLDINPLPHRSTDSRTHSLEIAQQFEQNIGQEHFQSENLEHCGENKDEAKTDLSQTSEGSTSHEAIIMGSSGTPESFSRASSPARHLLASLEETQQNPSPLMLRSTSKENLDNGDSIKSQRDHSQEDVKTPNHDATGGRSLSKDNTTGAPAEETSPPPTSDASSPHHILSSELATVPDPYSDLDPWCKASLNRFAAMLREESRAETNQDKLNIFNVFTSRESRLRVILYGTDDELIIPQNMVRQKVETLQRPEKGGFVKQAVERANSTGLDRSLKALPALPANRESVLILSGNATIPLVVQHGSTTKTPGVDLKSQPLGDDSELKESEMPNGPSGDDSYVMVDSPSNEVQYSSGGRLLEARLPSVDRETDVEPSHNAMLAVQKDSAASSKTPGSSRRADTSSSDGPIAVGLEKFDAPQKAAYIPPKYNEGRSEVKNYLANRKSVCRPYATLTHGSLENPSTFGMEEDIKLAGAASIVTAPTSLYNPRLQVKVDGVVDPNKQKTAGVEGPTDMRRFVKADFDPLLLALPKSDAVVPVSARIEDLRNVMEAVPDDFSFIHQSVVAWDAKAKKQREENDRQRHARQAESEQKIDSLFNDHEIGYGDIAELEIDLKRSEAARRADEDRFEYQTFVSDVFNLVWTRLHYELDQLIPHYDQYSKLMDHTLAGKDMFEGSDEGLALGPTMSSFLALHQKLEIRHQKAFEAVLERDRRLKKTEISPWYTLSNIAKVKQLEKQFEDAEKKAIIEYCQQRDARANHLMDVLDQNTLRGVGANQDYMEAIMKAVRRIASGRAFASVPGTNEPTAGLEEVEKAKAITALLASSSEQIVQTFHVADMLLNSADYEVSVAKAKVAKADMATLAKLKEERAKEDQKLMRDLEHRLALIREDTRRTNDEIVKLMLFLGVQNGRADSAPARAEAIDPMHEVRIQKALEEAKRRNVMKESEG